MLTNKLISTVEVKQSILHFSSQYRVDGIHIKLQHELGLLTSFIDGVANLRPKGECPGFFLISQSHKGHK
jgi:hypothetical protein